MKIAIVGAGQRGTLYAQYIMNNSATVDSYYDAGHAAAPAQAAAGSADIEFVAVVEPNKARRERAVAEFGIPRAYDNLDDFVSEGKIADAVIVATLDRNHYEHAMKLLALGYDLLLEKPIAPESKQCLEIQRKADEMGCEVIVCHVLRYTNFFSKVKELVDSGDFGRIITIEYAEYMGNFHMAHSFVRGKWRNQAESCQIFLQKSCHDMDVLTWLAGSPAAAVSSFGGLSYFREEKAPADSADRCADCPDHIASKCRFNAESTYMPMIGKWRAMDVTDDMTPEGMSAALETGPYGRCVFRCDNDVCDHQTANIEFENGITATFQMSGFSDRIHRRIKIMCEHGCIEGDDSENHLTTVRFGSFSEVPVEPAEVELDDYIGRHGGGDYGIAMDFVTRISEKLESGERKIDESKSAIARSIESHLICNAAEKSRITGQTVNMKEYIYEIKEELSGQ